MFKALAQRGDDAVALLRVPRAQDGIELLLPAVVLTRLCGNHMNQDGEPGHLPVELQELGLPVLQRVAARLEEVVPDLRLGAVELLLRGIGAPGQRPMADELTQEQDQG